MATDIFYYCFECDYATRTDEKEFLKDCLKTFDTNEVVNIGISVNNNPYNLRFFIFIHVEKRENKEKFERWLRQNYPNKYRRYNLFMRELFFYNMQTLIEDWHVDIALTEESNHLFLFPEENFLEGNHPQYLDHKRIPRVFLSHASEDKEIIVEPLFEYLQSQEVDVWLDKYEIDYGENVYLKISEGISNASAAIFVVTKNFLNKKWPLEEYSSLLHLTFNDKSLIVISSDVEDILPPMMKARKYIKWDEEKSLSEITSAIKRKLIS